MNSNLSSPNYKSIVPTGKDLQQTKVPIGFAIESFFTDIFARYNVQDVYKFIDGKLDGLFTLPPPQQEQKINQLKQDLEKSAEKHRESGWGLRVEFIDNKSPSLPQVLKVAEEAQELKKSEQNGKTLYQASYGKDDILKFKLLYDKIKSWKSTLFYINGEMIAKKELSRWLFCYERKLKYYLSSPLYCWGVGSSFFGEYYNIFGCHRITLRDSVPKFQDNWYKYGEMTLDGIFKPDKSIIARKIYDDLRPFRFCPALMPGAVLFGLSLIPDEINPKENEAWEYFPGDPPYEILPTLSDVEIDYKKGVIKTILQKTLRFNPCLIMNRITPQFYTLLNTIANISKKQWQLKKLPFLDNEG